MTDRALVDAKGEHVSPCCRVVMQFGIAACPACRKPVDTKEPKK